MYRWLFIAVATLWLVAMAALVRRDIWPAWTAQEAPRMAAAQFGKPGEKRREQFGIFDADDQQIGTAWGEVEVSPSGRPTITGVIFVDGLTLIPPVWVETSTEFDDKGELDKFDLDVYGVPMTEIKVRGERRGIYFPVELQLGTVRRQANLEMSASRMIGQSLRPFAVLPKLHVGQSWRMQILDPLSAIQGGRKAEFKSVVAEVTGKETITTKMSGKVECWVVEVRGQRAKAWVGPDGQVLQQEAAVPGVKKLTLKAESFSEAKRAEAAKRVRSTQSREKGQHGHRD